MKIVNIVSLLFLILLVSFSEISATKISGRITNIKGEPIPHLGVTIDSNRLVDRNETNQDGIYSFDCPEAVYKIYTETWVGKLSYADENYMPIGYQSFFRPATRANIFISGKSDIKVNFVLLESYSVFGEQVSGKGYSGVPIVYYDGFYHPFLEFDVVGFGKKMGNYQNVMIQYGTRLQEKGQNSVPNHYFAEGLKFVSQGRFSWSRSYSQ